MTRVKICGVTTPEDARDAALLGATAIGLNFHPPSPRAIDASKAAQIIDILPPLVSIVGVFVNRPDPQELEDFAVSLGLHAVQLHGNESPDYCSMIHRVKVIKAVRVDADFRVESLRGYGHRMFLLDTASPAGFGGTGAVFDWTRAYGANAFGSIVIAGGLTPENVGQAIQSLSPFGVDVSSGVESRPGEKDYEKMRRFIEVARAADAAPIAGKESL
ncbi:MAG TPA: phosphoribosylanthranilate isomerase [Terriglobia bacterium]|nr:phosphoribosylanthranilate isomerase [Terriglobia bacterium]